MSLRRLRQQHRQKGEGKEGFFYEPTSSALKEDNEGDIVVGEMMMMMMMMMKDVDDPETEARKEEAFNTSSFLDEQLASLFARRLRDS